MKTMRPLNAILAASILAISAPTDGADAAEKEPASMTQDDESALLDLSRQKWLWMADRRIDLLEPLFHDKAVFVHMGGNMTRSEELEIIRSGRIQYKHADVKDASAQVIGDTAIVLNKVRLTAVVGGNEVVNPFTVTEVFLRNDGSWRLAAMSFTRLLGD
jgi:hypothetical protein